MIGRSSTRSARWGREGGYFATDDEARPFEDELKSILVNQLAAFNSPVWFNVGFEEKPQCSACFILSIDDSMDSILDWIRREGVIFRGGSGSGVNLSQAALLEGAALEGRLRLRAGLVHARRRRVRRHDQVGGKTRRAAKMVVLDVDHPDIEEFIWCKAQRGAEGARPRAGRLRHVARLAPTGLDPVPEREQLGARHRHVHGVRRGRRGLEPDRAHRRHGRRDVEARDLLRQMAEAAWQCADPGMQYDTTINAWHTCPNSGRINASNPCSEYMRPRRLAPATSRRST